MRHTLGKYPGKTLHRIVVALIGIWITGNMLNLVWENPSNSIYIDLQKELKQDNKRKINYKE